jgi:phage antirepressor YoqD-like protein
MMTPKGIPPYETGMATSAILLETDELTSIRQCARLLQVHFTTLARWIRETPSITVRKIGAVHVVETAQVQRELAQRLELHKLGKRVGRGVAV